MPTKEIVDWFEEHRFVTLSLVMLIVFLSIMSFLWLKANEITNHPCSICANKVDQTITCGFSEGGYISQKIYYPNLTIYYPEF